MSMVALIAVASLAMAGQGLPKVGSTAPEFSAVGTDGKTHTLKSVTGEKDVFLYFISETCPVNAQAFKYYKRLSESYKDKANLVGVINADENGFKTWQKQFNAPFTVLFDPDMKIIRSYKAQASPWMIQVSSEGKIKKIWTGYSGPFLKQINTAMAAAAGVAEANIDLKGAPADFMFG
jgi:peroxiredoxin